MADYNEKRAHMIFKRLKACGFDVEIYKQRFGELTDAERINYNKFYGGFKMI